MARKKKKKNPVVRFLGSVVAFFKDDRFRYAMGIVFLLIALFLILSLVSYLINWKTDQDYEPGIASASAPLGLASGSPLLVGLVGGDVLRI